MDIDYYGKWACQKIIESSQCNMWDGHWACAVLALSNLLEEKLVLASLEPLIHENLTKTVEEHANEQPYRIIKKYAGFHNEMVSLLANKGQSLHAIGHDVIYTFYLTKMLSSSNVFATAELLDAIKRIVRDFAVSGPGFVTVNGENIVMDPGSIPDKGIKDRLSPETVLDFLHHFRRTLFMERGDMQLGHMLTHGHAIVEFKHFSSKYAFDNLDSAFHARINILTYANQLEDKEIGSDHSRLDADADSAPELNPLEPSYWQQALADSRHGHFYKYAYSFLKLSRMAGRTPSDFRLFSRIL